MVVVEDGWRSVNQQAHVAIQTKRSAFIMRLPSTPTKSGRGERRARRSAVERTGGQDQGSSLVATTLTGRIAGRDGAGIARFLGARIPLFGFGVGPGGSQGKVLVARAAKNRFDELADFVPLGASTLCQSPGPFRLTGPSWVGSLSFQRAERRGGLWLEIVQEVGGSRERTVLFPGEEARVAVLPEIPSDDDQDELVTIIRVALGG